MSYWIKNGNWETVPCNNCGCEFERLIDLYDKDMDAVMPPSYPPDEFTSPGKWRFVECPDCRLRFYSPRLALDEDYRDALFRNPSAYRQAEQVFANGSFFVKPDPGKQIAWLENHYKERVEKIVSEHLGRAPKSFYEFGCGVGRLIDVIQRMYPGIETGGCDPVVGMVDICRREFRHDVEVNEFQGAALPQGLDLIIGWNVIEHSFTPGDDIQKAYDALAPGGVLYLRTFHEEGNGDGLQTGPLGHQYHFFKDTLVDSLARRGFEAEMECDARTIHVTGKKS